MTTDGSESARPPEVDGGAGLDPVAGLAIGCGVLGIFVAQLLLVPVTMVLAAVAGRRSRDGHGEIGYAYTAFAIGAVDGVLLLVLLISKGHAPGLIPQ